MARLGLALVIAGVRAYFAAAAKLALCRAVPWPCLAVMAAGSAE